MVVESKNWLAKMPNNSPQHTVCTLLYKSKTKQPSNEKVQFNCEKDVNSKVVAKKWL